RVPNVFSYLRAALTLALGLVSATAEAQQPTPAQASAIRAACRADYEANCAGVPTGGMAALECLQAHAANVSPACQQALSAVRGGAPAPPAPAPLAAPPAPPAATAAPAPPASSEQAIPAQAPPTAAPTPGMDIWPHTYRTAAGTATIYEPQVIAW